MSATNRTSSLGDVLRMVGEALRDLRYGEVVISGRAGAGRG
jgi:hypothetical protein